MYIDPTFVPPEQRRYKVRETGTENNNSQRDPEQERELSKAKKAKMTYKRGVSRYA